VRASAGLLSDILHGNRSGCCHGETIADDDTEIFTAGIDDPENAVAAVVPERLDLFSRHRVPIPRSARSSARIHHES